MHLPSIDGNVKSPISDGEMYLTNSSRSKSEHEIKVEKGKKNVKLNELGK